MRTLLIAFVRAYQLFVSPFLGPHCRFHPTCSCYAHEALRRHGAVAGLYVTARRILKCHPWHEGGYDPVPDHSPLAARVKAFFHG